MSELNKVASFSELIRMVPEGWRSAEVYISDRYENVDVISRVSLHKDVTGKKVILIHKNNCPVPEN